MALVDSVIGQNAEFINAYSVVERLVGQQPSAGKSLVANRPGKSGTSVVVINPYLLSGGILCRVIRWLNTRRRLRAQTTKRQ